MAQTHPDFPRGAPAPRAGWTGGRIASLVIGVLAGLISLGLLAAGAAALWADTTQREDGYLSVGAGVLHTAGHALASGVLDLGQGGGWVAGSLVGRVRVEAVPIGAGKRMFVGIGPAGSVAAYLRGSRYATIAGLSARRVRYELHAGSARPVSPLRVGFWTARAAGPGAQTATWSARGGRWTAVVMNADGSAGVSADVVAGVSAPGLTAIAAGLLAAGAVVTVAAVMLIVIPVLRASRPRADFQT